MAKTVLWVSLTKARGAKADRREPGSCVSQVFNSKLGCFVVQDEWDSVHTHPHLKLRNGPKFCPASLSLFMTKVVFKLSILLFFKVIVKAITISSDSIITTKHRRFGIGYNLDIYFPIWSDPIPDTDDLIPRQWSTGKSQLGTGSSRRVISVVIYNWNHTAKWF